MKLFRMELYKIISRPVFLFSAAAAIFLMLAYFWIVAVGEEVATVDQNSYTGYEAVQVNKKITEEFKGVLTDEKVKQIIEKYGLPQVVEENYPGFRDSNYLNSFVTAYLSDGYLNDWNDYRLPTDIYTIEETELGELGQAAGKDILFTYTTGWNVFLEVLQIGMILGSILIILSCAVVFAEEEQIGMLQLIATTEEGPRKGIYAKLGAAFTVAAGVYLTVLGLDLIMCRFVYGSEGLDCMAGMVIPDIHVNSPLSIMRTGTYIGIVSLLNLLSAMLLCAVTLWISSRLRNSFTAVVLAAACWGLPVLLRIFFSGFSYIILASTPIFLIMRDLIIDIWPIWYIPVLIAAVALLGCTMQAVSGFRKQQVE